ncbi:hypothetical protein WMY93_031057 [Mugilogobius chulae]|uniref:Uncharacterized protein n=1 Tax=Mugilogobius chulae TaxID=88201 RepID=A0AAW0MFH9_9GOBI
MLRAPPLLPVYCLRRLPSRAAEPGPRSLSGDRESVRPKKSVCSPAEEPLSPAETDPRPRSSSALCSRTTAAFTEKIHGPTEAQPRLSESQRTRHRAELDRTETDRDQTHRDQSESRLSPDPDPAQSRGSAASRPRGETLRGPGHRSGSPGLSLDRV